MPETVAPRRHKLLFWIVIAAYSTFFAEVFAGSDMFPFFNTWGVLVVWPLYGLHTLVLSTIIFRHGKPSLSTLVFAGALFGLYEAYMTKVLWDPNWGALFKIGGVAVVEMVVLVLWWHTWLSFITPLTVGEITLTHSRETVASLPGRIRAFYTNPRNWLLLLVFGGLFQSINSPSVESSLLSGFSTTAFLIALTLLWRFVTRNHAYTLRDLLPGKTGFRLAVLWLAALYLFLGFNLQREALPGLLSQAIIWACYALVIFLFVRALRRSARQKGKTQPVIQITWWLAPAVILTFTLSTTLGKAVLSSLNPLFMLVGWVFGGAFGLLNFACGWHQLKPTSEPEGKGVDEVEKQTPIIP